MLGDRATRGAALTWLPAGQHRPLRGGWLSVLCDAVTVLCGTVYVLCSTVL
jgi:hypothetical protein